MPRHQFSRFMGGRHGFGKVFKRSPVLRRRLSRKQKKYALKTLAKYKRGKGITFRGGPGMRTELQKARKRWRDNTKDPISRRTAKLIDKELKKYGRNLQQNPDVPRGSRKLLRRPSAAFGSDPRAILNRDPDGTFRGDRDDRPSMMYGGSDFDDEGSGYDHGEHLGELRGLDDHMGPDDVTGPFDRPGDNDEPPGHDAT